MKGPRLKDDGEPMKYYEEIRQAANSPRDYARRLKKESGKKMIGYVCSYVPEEIILAAGAHPLRLFGAGENASLADSHLQAYCCSLVRGILEEGLSQRAAFLDGMVFPHTCDSVQRLSDIWRLNIPFGFHLDLILPVKLNTESAGDYMVDVLRRFREEIGAALGADVTVEALNGAIAMINSIRMSLRTIYELCSVQPGLLSGEELYTLVRASMVMDRERLAVLLAELVVELKAGAGKAADDLPPKRIVVAGGICNHPDIYSMIEEAGGAVVWDDLCTGARYFSQAAANSADPIAGIAERLLTRMVCPAKHADLDTRAKHLIRIVKERHAKGVVYLLLKFCDPHAFDYPDIKKSLDDAGIPAMLMEIADPLPPGGQLKTRLEAFLEML